MPTNPDDPYVGDTNMGAERAYSPSTVGQIPRMKV
jgi:hypothetical protein